MRYGSICSGIEAVTVAWRPLGWDAVFFSEIAALPSRVLAHHWPYVRNFGDFTRIYAPPAIDILVGGTPCQSFSCAGLRGGLGDGRGNLALEFFRLAHRARPRWILWENVPGVLSTNGGRDFGSILGALVHLGYGWAYRVLDAQYFGVPQRRRRVFVVGCARGWPGAAAVLLEREGLRRNPPPRRAKGAAVAGTPGAGSHGSGWRGDLDRAGLFLPTTSHALTTRSGQRQDPNGETYITHTLMGSGFDASEDGTGRGTPLITSSDHAIAFDMAQVTRPENRSRLEPGKPSPTLTATGDVATAFDIRQDPSSGDVCPPLTRAERGKGVKSGTAVRRITPREAERLQGFPDEYTALEGASDSARYEAIGNSMAVPVMRWLGRRIEAVDRILEQEAA